MTFVVAYVIVVIAGALIGAGIATLIITIIERYKNEN